jgi:hypothetical protein
MPWPVYTETFIRTQARNTWTVYTVPAGRRAVVKSVMLVNGGAAAGEVHVQVGETSIVFVPFQAAYANQIFNLTAVAYAGQTVSCLATAISVHQTISGYQFRETGVLRGGTAGG